jgi:hypothetical protein
MADRNPKRKGCDKQERLTDNRLPVHWERYSQAKGRDLWPVSPHGERPSAIAASAALCFRLDGVETLVSAAALVTSLILLWTGRRRLEVSSAWATFLSVIDVAVNVIAVVTLGWLGVTIFIAVSLIALIVWSVVLAIKKQLILVGAAVQGADVSRQDAEDIWQWMGTEKSFAAIPPLKRAELIKALAIKARKPEEIRAMAVPIAQLSLIFDCDPLWLAPRFDQLLRLYGQDADEATETAETLTTSTQLAPISFKEMVEAMLTAGGTGPSDTTESATDHSGKDQFSENLRATTELQIRQDTETGVRLNGGPMDGWLVLRNAPSLAADWYKTWPPGIAEEHEPGLYEVADSGTWAEWVRLDARN